MDNLKSYLGTGWAFPPTFIKESGVSMISDDDDIKQSLAILFSTTPGERIFRFEYGCNIHRFVFEEMTLSNETLMIDHIKRAILHFEPRISVEKVAIDTKDYLDGTLWIHIEYKIRATNNRSNIVYPFYFKEGTNL